ncbi:PLP-dependent aminotransferase family protein [Mucilaginibacter sp. RS28]|uniref:PLP-dependent aminotransferase family protein n=1 Tax=Mucilaginibacter straminoryzae TaxID=2932774 RepID=A0A9X1WYP8_9SPHI|nr:PLP-dependent aminotransferase family protein [Mucilaginibacter straminoryzae]MCJ8208102.1 PLP-dependent aminotransferase family protein [Mucilaginibacter straminoryzae]
MDIVKIGVNRKTFINPMLRKWKIPLQLSFDGTRPLYQQIEAAIEEEIKKGRLAADTAMPGTRELAKELKVHRKTVVQAYDRLLSRGLLYTRQKQGTFVAAEKDSTRYATLLSKAPFAFRTFKVDFTEDLPPMQSGLIKFDDGFPDPRLGPLLELTGTYRTIFKRTLRQRQMEFQNPKFYDPLRDVYINMLNQQRGLNVSPDRACFVVGQQMGLYMVAQVLLKKEEVVASCNPGDPFAWHIFQSVGAKLAAVRSDEKGMDTAHLEELLKTQKIKLVYTSPQCQYPTTATMSHERRRHLLQLSETYGFAIIEADYDHEYWYGAQPYVPLAAEPHGGQVIYISALSKLLPPFYLMGVVCGPADFIRSLTALREMIGQQGDILLEHATEDLIRDGVIAKAVRKSVHHYKEKREYVSAILYNYLYKHVQFQVPQAGLAYFLQFRDDIDLTNLLTRLKQKGIYIRNPGSASFDDTPPRHLRIGFGALDLRELEQGVKTIADILSA